MAERVVGRVGWLRELCPQYKLSLVAGSLFLHLKGLGHQMDISSKTFKIKSVLSEEMGCLVNKEK